MTKKADDTLASLGRFSEPALHILIALADGPKHGYAMTQDRRRPYKLTSAGGKVLRARLDALRSVTKIAQARLANA